LLSDVHANLEALEACLAAAPPYDMAVNLGDVVGYGANPNEVIERMRRVCRVHVRGNHDKACAGLITAEGFNPVAAAAAAWTRAQLTPDNLEWLQAIPAGPVAAGELEDVHFVHGSALDEDEYVIDVEDAIEPLLRREMRLTFFGHTHLQGGFSLYRDQGSEVHNHIDHGDAQDTGELRLNRNASYLINPGSVGQPRDGDWRAGFALFDSSHQHITFYRIPYDIQSTRRRILDAALPERLATRLAIGR
jgi:diadenosine tetraphosphatase ApaH/serine/threonine PP2A family protein phosphatase